MKEIKEENILKAVQKVLDGKSSSFLTIYEAYYGMAISIMRRVLHASELDEAVNGAFLIVYKSLKNFKQKSKLSTYVYRIILNYAFQLAKKENKRKALFPALHEGQDIEHIAGRYNVEKSVVERYFVEQALSTLNKDMTEALDLYYFQDHSVKEIAKICKVSENTVKSRIFQARIKIRGSMPEGVIHG